jgi:PAS domain S-box-containing protein
MNIFAGGDANLPTQLWIASRFFFAGSLLAAPFFLKRRASVPATVAVCSLAAAAIFGLFFFNIFPACYIEGQGLTPFKVCSEYCICLMLTASLFLHYRYRSLFDPEVWGYLTGAIIATILAELMFTLYENVYGFLNFFGHIFVITAMYLFYHSIVVVGIKQPHRLLYRDLQQSKDEIAQLNTYNRSLIDNAPISIVIISREGIIQDANKVVEMITGNSRDQLIGMPHTTWFTEPEKAEEAFRIALSGHPVNDLSFIIRHRDGRLTPVLANAAPLRDAGGTITGVILSSIDITRRKKAEDALRFANEKLNILSSITRHDILNQLTALLGFLELSRNRTTNPSTRDFIDRGEKAAQNIRRQIEFTREYQNLGVKAPAWTNVSDAFSRAVTGFGFTGRTMLSPACKGLEVYADALFEKVFYNLVDNSLRHGERVTEITLSCSASGNGMIVIYQDNGVGIPADEKERIFEKGFGKNTGLGLFLAREILTITGITITETGTPQEGAQFEMLVPEGTFRIPANSPKDLKSSS